MTTFRSYHSKVAKPVPGKQPDDTNLTIENDAYTIQELFEKHLAGMPLSERPMEYFDVEDISHINEFFAPHIDLTDFDRLSHRIAKAKDAIERAKAKRDADVESNAEPDPEPTPDPEP